MTTANTLKIGPYSRPATLARIDGRSREARFRKALRAELVRHVGARPSAVQSALIELVLDTSFQIELMKRSRDVNGALTSHDHRVFLAWSNTLRRSLMQLGVRGQAERAPTLTELLAQPKQAA
jgi:hypothetical protein